MVSPKFWKVKTLGELLDVQNGYAFTSEKFSKHEGIPLIRIRDLKNGKDTEVGFVGEYNENYIVKSGDLLVGMDGEFRCYQWQGRDALLNQRVCRLINFSNEIDPEFVFYGINNHLQAIENDTPYVTVKHLSAKKIKNVQFAYPNLTEQRRIVACIKGCMERVDKIDGLRKEAIHEHDFILQSLIEEQFQDIQGKQIALSEACSITSTLVDPSQTQYLDLPHIGGGNIEAKTGYLHDIKTARKEKLKSSKFVFDKTMVLYNKIRPYLMKVALPDFSGLCSADMYPLSPNPDKLYRKYLFYLLLSKRFTDYAISGSNRAGMPKVNRNHLFSFKFYLPTLDEQLRVVNRLDEAAAAVNNLKIEINGAVKETLALRESILRKAFAGEL